MARSEEGTSATVVERSKRFDWRRFLLLQAILWTTYGVVHFAASLPAIAADERDVIAFAKAIRALTGFAVSSALVPLLRARTHPYTMAWWVLFAFAAIVAGFAWMFLDRVTLVSAAALLQLTIPWVRFVHGMDLDYVFVMLAWTGGFVAFALFQHSRDQREELLKRQMDMQSARLNLLAAQLNPHFLFNSLNTIRSLAAEDPIRTREVVSRLSSFLRRVISFDPTVPVPLAQEIDLARDYLSVEEARFETGMVVAFNVDPETGDALVPPLILQPLLENALRHGDADSDGVQRIVVASARAGSDIEVSITNTGKLNADKGPQGIGLELTRSRLEQMYGKDASLSIEERDGTVAAMVRIRTPQAGS